MKAKLISGMGKKILSFVLILAMVLSLLPSRALAAAAVPNTAWMTGASGGEADPYILTTVEDLAGLAQLVVAGNSFSGRFFELRPTVGDSLDFSGYSQWTPIGTLEEPFEGTLDGMNVTLSHFTIEVTDGGINLDEALGVGLFGRIGAGGTVKNLVLEDADINVNYTTILQSFDTVVVFDSSDTYAYVGAIAGVNEGTIANCQVSGQMAVAGRDVAAGAIVGNNGTAPNFSWSIPGIITNCDTDVDLSVTAAGSWAYAGGIAGSSRIMGSRIENGTSTGSVTGSADGPSMVYVGGLAGYLENTSLSDSFSSAGVSFTTNNTTLSCAGGLIGTAYQSSILNSGCSGDVHVQANGAAYAGGLAGMLQGTRPVSNSYATGNVEAVAGGMYANSNAGGFAGSVDGMSGPIPINSCYASGDVSSVATGSVNAFSGGFLAHSRNAVLTDCYATGDARAESPTYLGYAGGFTAYVAASSRFIRCYSAGTAGVLAASADAGGFFGIITGAAELTGVYYKSNGNISGRTLPGTTVTGAAVSLPIGTMTGDQVLTGAMSGLVNAGDTWVKRPNEGIAASYLPELAVFHDSDTPSVQAASKISVLLAPEVTATLTPSTWASEIDPQAPLSLTFNVSVTPVAGKTLSIYRADNDELVESIPVDDGDRVSMEGNTVTARPSSELYYNGSYYILVDSGAFVSSAGKKYAGIATNTGWRYMTAERQEVIATDSQALDFYMENSSVSRISLLEDVAYGYDGGTVSRDLTIEGNGAVIMAGTGDLFDVRREDGITVTGLGNYTDKSVYLTVAGDGEPVHLTLENLTLRNACEKNGADNTQDGLFAVINLKTNASLSMDNVTLEEFHNNPTPGNELCFGIHAEPRAASTTITNSSLGSSNAFRNAVAIRGGDFQITGNSFTGTVHPERLRQSDGYEYGIYIYGGEGLVSDNTITGYDSTTQDGYASSGISATAFYSADYVIENNTLSGNSFDIDLTAAWSDFSSNTFMRVNGIELDNSGAAYALGQLLDSANPGSRISLTLDQSDLIQLENDQGVAYYQCFGGYRSHYLSVAATSPDAIVLQLPLWDLKGLEAASSVEFEAQLDGENQWLPLYAGETRVTTQATLALEPGYIYRIRAKLVHTTAPDGDNPDGKVLITYTNSIVTGDNTPPVISNLLIGSVGVNTAAFDFTSDEAGNIYYLVLPSSAEAPNGQEVKTRGTVWMQKAGTGSNSFSVSGLEPDTAYVIYLVVEDESTNLSEVTALDFATNELPVEQRAPGAPSGVSAAAGNAQAIVSFTAPGDDGGSPITGYTVYVYRSGIKQDNLTVTGVSASPVTVTGLTNGTAYSFTVVAVNAIGEGAESVLSERVTPNAPPTDEEDEDEDDEDDNTGGSTGVNTGGSTGSTPGAETVEVLINGKSENAGTATTVKKDGRTVTTVVVDAKKLEQKLAAEGDNAVITIPVLKTEADTVVAKLNGRMVKNMEGKQAVIEVKTNDAVYTLPSGQIAIDAVLAQLGSNVSLEAIDVSIEISAASDEMARIVENAAEKGAFTVVLPPLTFTVKCTAGDKTVEVSSFNTYVARTVAIPEGVDPSRITTGVVVDPDGTSRHVPTQVTLVDGRYYAVIKSLTNSTYSVVWHPIEFKDVEKHWARTAVNDMGSRMIISSVSGNFDPNRTITRGEFAAIMVTALGLKPGTGENPYRDVKSGDWYLPYVQTVHAYGLMSGYGNGIFGANEAITREQVTAIIGRAMKLTELEAGLTGEDVKLVLSAYTDWQQASSWARESLAACVKTGIVTGTAADRLSPKNAITRAEVAVMVRLLLIKSGLI